MEVSTLKHLVLNGTEEEFYQEIKADTDHAQLLIQIGPNTKTLEEAKQIIEETGVRITEMKPLSSHWILMKLDVKDMRSVVFKLMETGFSNIKGINAIDPKICDFS
jgi:hypothetical protein